MCPRVVAAGDLGRGGARVGADSAARESSGTAAPWLTRGVARDLRSLGIVELWKLRKDIGVVRASLADVLAQAEAARRAVDQLRWLLRENEPAKAAEQQIAGALERVNAAVGHLCESATNLQEAAKSTVTSVGEPASDGQTANIDVRRR